MKTTLEMGFLPNSEKSMFFIMFNLQASDKNQSLRAISNDFSTIIDIKSALPLQEENSSFT